MSDWKSKGLQLFLVSHPVNISLAGLRGSEFFWSAEHRSLLFFLTHFCREGGDSLRSSAANRINMSAAQGLLLGELDVTRARVIRRDAFVLGNVR